MDMDGFSLGRTAAIAIVVIALFAGGIANADVLQQAVQEYLEPGMQIVDALQMPLENGSSAYILPIDGSETLMIGNWSPKAIEDEAEILAVLQGGIRKQANLAGAKADLRVLVQEIRDGKSAPEAQCALYTGTEHNPCTDKDTCNVAAQSSPQAQIMIQADGFWQNMRDWYLKKMEIDAALDSLDEMADSGDDGKQYAADVAIKLRAAYEKMQQLDSNGLLQPGLYGIDRYCPEMPWPYLEILQAESRWKGISTTLSTLDGARSRAHSIALRTKAWMDYTKTRASDFLKMERALDARILKIEGQLEGYNGSIEDDTGLNAKFARLQNGTAAAVSAGNGGRYHEALGQNATLNLQAGEIEAKVEADFKVFNTTLRYLDNAKKASAKLAQMGKDSEGAEIAEILEGVASELSNMPKSTRLTGIAAQAKLVESRALEAVAVAMLEIDMAQEEANTSGQNANPKPSGVAGNSSADNQAPQPIPCPLPFAVGAGAMLGIVIYSPAKKR